MNLSLFVARRYLFSRKSSNAVNIVTRISLACVCVVTAALVIILSAMNGLTGLVESLYNNFHSDIRITAEKGKVFHSDTEKVKRIKQIPGVAWYSEIIDEDGLIESNDRQMNVVIRGVSDDYARYTRFDTVVREGRFDLHPNGLTGAVAGQEIGSVLALSELSQIKIYVPKRDRNLVVDMNNMDEKPFNEDVAFLSGLYFVSSDFDGKYIFLPAETVRGLLEYTDECTSAEIGIKSGFDEAEVIRQVKEVTGAGYKVQSRYEQNEVLYKTLQSEKMWTFFILIFVLVIATFNTIGSITLLIIEKKKDIGILWGMGAGEKLIRRIFFTEGVLISVAGTIAGISLGLLLCWLQKTFGLLRFGEGFVVSFYPVEVQITDLLYIVLAVTAIGILAAWYPVNVFTRKYQQIKLNN
jgi:lipoprotein-releasing system permease protein